jgi:hypothetical protein
MSYTVRFDRGNRGWTCSVFRLEADGVIAGPSVASGTGLTKDAARDATLAVTEDAGIRVALTSLDIARPYWVQGALGEQREAQRLAEINEAPGRKRSKKSRMA